MVKDNFVIVMLLVAMMSIIFMWNTAEKRVSYLEGRNSVAQDIQDTADEVTQPYPLPEHIARKHRNGK